MTKSRALGSVISSLKYKKRKGEYSKKKQSSHDIDVVIKRLEGYKKYKKQLYDQMYNVKRKKEQKLLKYIKKISYRKAFSYKPVSNPYIELYKNGHRLPTPPDPNLMKQYKLSNIYAHHTFRHLPLPRSGYNVKAGQAWYGLSKAWKGYYISKRYMNEEHQKLYASAAQKWAFVLELDEGIPNFEDIGLSNIGFLNARFLKEYVKGYENETIF